MRFIFKGFGPADNFNVARGYALDAGHSLSSAEQSLESRFLNCDRALNEIRMANYEMGQAAAHEDLADRAQGSNDGLKSQLSEVYKRLRDAEVDFADKCVLRKAKPASEPLPDIDVEEVEAAPAEPSARAAPTVEQVRREMLDAVSRAAAMDRSDANIIDCDIGFQEANAKASAAASGMFHARKHLREAKDLLSGKQPAAYRMEPAQQAADACYFSLNNATGAVWQAGLSRGHIEKCNVKPQAASAEHLKKVEAFVTSFPDEYRKACGSLVGKAPAPATKPPQAKKAKAPKRVKAPKTDWLEPPPGEPGVSEGEMEEAVEAARTADTEGPRITIRPATDEDAPDVGAKLTLEPGDGTWSEPPKRKRNERKAAPREIPPLPEEAFKPARKKAPGERGNTRTLEYTSRSGKVCRIRINSRPDGCLLIED